MDRVRCHQLYGDGLGRMRKGRRRGGGWGWGAKGGKKENGRENLSLYYIHVCPFFSTFFFFVFCFFVIVGVPFPACSLSTLLMPVSMGPVA